MRFVEPTHIDSTPSSAPSARRNFANKKYVSIKIFFLVLRPHQRRRQLFIIWISSISDKKRRFPSVRLAPSSVAFLGNDSPEHSGPLRPWTRDGGGAARDNKLINREHVNLTTTCAYDAGTHNRRGEKRKKRDGTSEKKIKNFLMHINVLTNHLY